MLGRKGLLGGSVKGGVNAANPHALVVGDLDVCSTGVRKRGMDQMRPCAKPCAKPYQSHSVPVFGFMYCAIRLFRIDLSADAFKTT